MPTRGSKHWKKPGAKTVLARSPRIEQLDLAHRTHYVEQLPSSVHRNTRCRRHHPIKASPVIWLLLPSCRRLEQIDFCCVSSKSLALSHERYFMTPQHACAIL